jgi:hypothetical protein
MDEHEHESFRTAALALDVVSRLPKKLDEDASYPVDRVRELVNAAGLVVSNYSPWNPQDHDALLKHPRVTRRPLIIAGPIADANASVLTQRSPDRRRSRRDLRSARYNEDDDEDEDVTRVVVRRKKARPTVESRVRRGAPSDHRRVEGRAGLPRARR